MQTFLFFVTFFGIIFFVLLTVIVSVFKKIIRNDGSFWQNIKIFFILIPVITLMSVVGYFIRSGFIESERNTYEAKRIRWGAISKDGKWLIAPDYEDELSDFNVLKTTFFSRYNNDKQDYDTIALDSAGKKTKYIPNYSYYLNAKIEKKVLERATHFYEKVADDITGIYIDSYAKNGFVRCYYKAKGHRTERYAYRTNYYFYVDTNGIKVIEPKLKSLRNGWGSASDFENGYAMVHEKDTGIVFVNTKGIYANIYDKAKPFSAGVAPVFTYKDDWQLIDTTFKVIQKLPKNYGDVSVFSENKAIFRVGEMPLFNMGEDTTSCGFIDPKGTVIIDANFRNAKIFSENLAAVKDKKTNLWGFINDKGNWIIKPQFTNANSFHYGGAIVAISLPDSRPNWKKILDIY